MAHGTTEHMGRYEAFAAAMAARGVAVAGFDLRGHGRNPGDSGVAAFVPGDWRASVEDVRLFHGHLGRVFPGARHAILMDEPEKTCEIIGDWITASGI